MKLFQSLLHFAKWLLRRSSVWCNLMTSILETTQIYDNPFKLSIFERTSVVVALITAKGHDGHVNKNKHARRCHTTDLKHIDRWSSSLDCSMYRSTPEHTKTTGSLAAERLSHR